ncbi:MAG: hypothetical protein V3T14_02015, partial [Myxococcota bacterium]
MRRANFLYICGLAVAFIFAAAPADAAVDKCQAAIEKEADKLKRDVRQRLEKCFDFVEKERTKRQVRIAQGKGDQPNWDFTKAADSCEKQLSKTYASGGSISKYKGRFNSLFPSKCTDDDLVNLENLVGGRGAPGSPNHAFVREWTMVGKLHEAVQQAINSNGKGRDLLQYAMEGFPAGDFG